MKPDVIIALICLVIDAGLFIYNRFYFKEAIKADEQIGIPFHPLLIKYIKLNMIFIGIAAAVTFLYFVISLFR